MEQTMDETFFPIPRAISADNSAFISNFPPSIDRLTLSPLTFSLDRSRIISEYFDFSLSNWERERERERGRSIGWIFRTESEGWNRVARSNARTAKRVSGPSGRPAPPEIEYMNAKFQRRSGPPRIRLSNPVENSDSLGAASRGETRPNEF